MAFIARRNDKGKRVEQNLLSGRAAAGRDSPMPNWGAQSDNDESDAGLTDRTLVAEADTDTDTDTSSCTLVGDRGDVGEYLESDAETLKNFCQELEEDEAADALTGLHIDGNESPIEEDWLSESPTLVHADSIGDCSDLGDYQGDSSPTASASVSSQSMFSWTNAYADVLEPSKGGDRFLPSLNLESSRLQTGRLPSGKPESAKPNVSASCKSSEQKECERKLRYEEWVQRKNEQKKEDLLAKKRASERLERLNKERMEQSEQKVREWNLKKAQLLQEQRNKKPLTIPKKSSTTSVPTNASRPRETPEERRQRLQVFERSRAAREQRLAREQEEKEQRILARRQLADGAFSRWMENVHTRPKPVPFNQGFDSLRGTASKIYINPKEWDSSIDPPSDARDV
ncbi:uncharacterized protein LOC117889675 [Drosophila subobscura]|uniref:uncharacterized protein LOC117889675 n=1 Tax=Drosophila subobscura TaxID=7241 RepID=UPI00155B158E|nr:uncharacterized protein LOC117889675 [Drosophila subobscura]XP_034650006.1 uncharacterized protein LOC117889675 [Drosophila subobscura]